MRAFFKLGLGLMFVLGGQLLIAQCVGNKNGYLDVNQVEAIVNNQGEQFAESNTWGNYRVPKSTFLSPLDASNFWIGGLSPQGQLHMAASQHSNTAADFKIGPCRTIPNTVCTNTFETATIPFSDGFKNLSNGKVLALDSLQVLIYDPITRQTITRPWPTPRGWVDALELQDGRVMFFGDHNYPTKNPILLMDTLSYNFSPGPILNWFHRESSATELLDGRVLLAGVVGCEIWDPSTNQSTAVPDMIYPRMKHAAERLPNGDVMVFGGGSSLNGTGFTQPMQRFDDSLGFWFPAKLLLNPRNNPSALTLPDGRILILGGNVNTGTSAEYYDPVLDSVYAATLLFGSQEETNMRLLSNGDLMVSGYDPQNAYGEISIYDLDTGFVGSLFIGFTGAPIAPLAGDDAIVNLAKSRECQHVRLSTSFQYHNPWQYIWKLSRSEIDQFKADYLAQAVDFTRYPHIEFWPAHGSVADGEDRNLAPFVDVNGDGLYRPEADGDYPCIVGDQALWWVVNDQGFHPESNGLPMDLQLEVMAYAFDCQQTPCPDTSLDYATFFHYEISNRSDTAWSDMYVGGGYSLQNSFLPLNFVGSDTSLDLAFGYHGDNFDDFGYGARPAAWGATVLPNGQLSQMNSVIHPALSGMGHERYPTNPQEYYNYMKGFWADSLPLVDNGLDGYPSTAMGTATPFAFPSTAGFCGGALSGWSELIAGQVAGERHFVQGSGPFTLQPGDQIQYDLGYFIARDSTNIGSVCALKDATTTLRDWWQNQLDRSCFSVVVGREEAATSHTFSIYPNPTGIGIVQADFGEALAEAGELLVMDIQGRLLQREFVEAGAVGTRLDLQGRAKGLYLLRLQAGDRVATQKLVLQ